MNTKHILIFWLPFIALWAIGCSDMRYAESVMDDAEAVMSDNPDSAYYLLRGLNVHSVDDDALLSRYAFLYTKAQYKSYREDGNDSLISIAVHYYDAKGRKPELMESLMLLSVQQKVQSRFSEAMMNLQRAADIGEELGDDFMLGRIYTNLFLLCLRVYDSDGLKYAEKALKAYRHDGNDLYVIDGMCNLGIAYYQRQEFEQSAAVLDTVYQWALRIKDDFIIRKAARVLAMIDAMNGKYESSDSLFLMLHDQYGYDYLPQDIWALAEACLARGQRDKALALMNQASAMKMRPSDEVVFGEVASDFYAKVGCYEEALRLLQKSKALKDSTVRIRLQESVLASQRDYVVQKLEVEQMRSSRNMILSISLTVGMLVLLAFIVYYYKRRLETHSLEMENLMLQVADLKNEATNRDSAIAGLSGQVYELFNQKYRQIDELCVSYFTGQNTMFARNTIYREVQKIIESFGSDKASFAELERIVDASHDGVLTKLKSEVPKLRDSDYRYFCYVFAGFSSRAISLLTHESIDAVYQHRSRWKRRIESLNPPHKDLFLQNFR